MHSAKGTNRQTNIRKMERAATTRNYYYLIRQIIILFRAMLQHSVSLTHVCNVHCVRTTNVSEYTELNKQQTNKDKAQNKMEKEISLKKKTTEYLGCMERAMDALRKGDDKTCQWCKGTTDMHKKQVKKNRVETRKERRIKRKTENRNRNLIKIANKAHIL